MSSIDFSAYDALTFDYGTLIDWETGILNGLWPVLAAHRVERDDEELLEGYAGHEAKLEAGPYLSYRGVLAASLHALGGKLGFAPSEGELEAFSRSVSKCVLGFGARFPRPPDPEAHAVTGGFAQTTCAWTKEGSIMATSRAPRRATSRSGLSATRPGAASPRCVTSSAPTRPLGVA